MSLQSCFSLISQKRYKDALNCLRQLGDTASDSIDVIRATAFCLVQTGNAFDAITFIEEAVQRVSSPASLVVDVLQVYIANGQAETGLDRIESLLKHVEDLSSVPADLVSLLLQYGNRASHARLITRLCAEINLPADVFQHALSWLKDRQYSDEALVLLDKTPDNQKNNSQKVEKAILLRLSGKPADALPILLSLDKQMTHFAIKHNLGNAYSDLGQLDTARGYYAAAMSLNPAYLESHVNYHKMNWELGHTETYGDSLKEMAGARANYPQSFLAYVNLLMQAKKYQEAKAALETEREYLDPLAYHHVYSKLLTFTGDYDAALDAFDAFTSIQPLPGELVVEKATALIGLSRFTDAEQLLARFLEQDIPLNERNIARATFNTCRRLQGEQTVKPEDVKTFSFDQRHGVVLQDIENEVRVLHTAKHAPLNQSVSGGSQTRGNLFPSQQPALSVLEQFIREQVVHYINDEKTTLHKTLSGSTVHDADVFFTGSWSVLLKGKGFHTSHYHSKAHISGVIYLVVPDCVEDENDRLGWLHFGKPWLNHDAEIQPEDELKPEPGKLVLFPSHTWHGTNPINDGAERMTIAFDVLIR